MKKIAFVFPGQGAQYVGMAKDVVIHHEACKNIVQLADQRLGFSLSQLMFEGPEEQLKETEYAQPALLTTSIACLQLLKEAGIIPDSVAGHSLGEYSALVCAEALSFEDALWLVHQRGLYMKEAVPSGEGTMVAVLGLEAEKLQQLCDHCSQYGIVEMANFNCPGQIVVSGERLALEQVMAKAKDYGAKRAIALAVSGPFHSRLLAGAGEKLSHAIDQVTVHDGKVDVIANISAKSIKTKEEISQALVKQVSSPVLWTQTIETMVQDGVEIIIEIGAGKVLSGLIKKIAPDVTVLNVEDMASFNNTIDQLKTLLK